jgi:hypothetical protein
MSLDANSMEMQHYDMKYSILRKCVATGMVPVAGSKSG